MLKGTLLAGSAENRSGHLWSLSEARLSSRVHLGGGRLLSE